MYKAFLFTMNDMVWFAGSDAIDNFPISKYQATKYYVTQPCKVAGSLQQRHTSNSQFQAHKPTHEKRMSKSDDTLYDKLEYRNLKIGIEIGTDVFGPAYGLCVSVFVDKACGFGKSNYYKHNSKSAMKHASDNSDNTTPNYVLESIKWCHNYYTKYGHTIHALCSDSFNVYRCKKSSWYAVMRGRVPGVYNSYDQAHAQIHQFPGDKLSGHSDETLAHGALTCLLYTSPSPRD